MKARKINKKAMALLLGLTLGVSGTAFAAEGADSFSDVPQGHWAYDALDFLAKDGVIEGMGDGTFQGNRTMTRYEMASIVAKAMQKGGLGIGDQAVLDKLAAEYGNELATLKKQTAQNTKDIEELKNGIAGKLSVDGFIRLQYDHDKSNLGDADKNTAGSKKFNDGNDRFYYNVNGAYKVNDNWKAKFQLEKNTAYHHSGAGRYNLNETGLSWENNKGHVNGKGWSGHDGNIQRIWVEGYFPKSDSWVSIGRAWRGLGQQNQLQGNETDGLQAGIHIPGTNLTGSAFWFTPSTGDSAIPAWYGVGTWGKLGHNVGINLAYAHREKDKDDDNTKMDNAYVLSGWWDIAKNLQFQYDYTHTNADEQNHGSFYRLNYRNTDLSKPGSYQLYTRYIYKQHYSNIAGDDEWGSLPNNMKGWIFSFKYVPWKNVEWETFYSRQKAIQSKCDVSRDLVRTQVDFHF